MGDDVEERDDGDVVYLFKIMTNRIGRADSLEP